MQRKALTLFPSFYFFFFSFILYCSSICYLHVTGRFASVDPSCFLNFLWFCLYCMYFFKGFWGRPRKYRSACERGRTCIFTGYPPPLQLQSGLLCTCITEAPNKTHCGWLVRKGWAPSATRVLLLRLHFQKPSHLFSLSLSHFQTHTCRRPKHLPRCWSFCASAR